MIAENLLGEGGEGSVYLGEWHGEPAAFKAIPFKGDTNDAQKVMIQMQESLKEIYSLIDMQKAIIAEAKKTGKELRNELKLEPVLEPGRFKIHFKVFRMCCVRWLISNKLSAARYTTSLYILFVKVAI